MFYAPEEATLHAKQVEREKLRAAQEALKQVHADDEEHNAEPEEKYYPLAPQQWRKEFMDLKKLHVMKFPRILQCLFYLLGYSREEICERDTAMLNFKKTKALITDKLFQ